MEIRNATPKILIVLILAMGMLATRAAADHRYVDIETLYGWCKPYEIGDIGPGPLCAGYINAIADILAHNMSLHDHRACIPKDVTLNDLRNHVVLALENRPNGPHANAHRWVAKVLARAYPCVAENGQ